jgi:hypothetical protein
VSDNSTSLFRVSLALCRTVVVTEKAQALVGTLRLIAPTKTLLLTAVRMYLKEYGRKVGPRKSKSAFEQIPQAD